MLEAGQTIAGRYCLESPIGEGAMASVWRAEDQTLKRQVAIKLLYVKGTRDPQAMVDQFLREARIAASVQHRNVIHTQDFGTVGEAQPFMVMELLNGESLGDRMEREPRLSEEQLIQLVSLTLRGLAAVHDAGIVHRDLKPHNIFLQRDADAIYPKILDFGISRSLEAGEDRPSAIATQQGMIVGTPDYMSPEQACGEANIDRRADIYAMGVILYEGLGGRLPFEAQNIGDLIVQIVTKEPPRLAEVAPHISSALSDMVAQAMSKDREGRFADARAMRSALLAAAEKRLPAPRRPGASKPPPPARAPGAAGPPPQRAKAPGSGATWGDFEGLSMSAPAAEPPPAPVVSGNATPPAAVSLPASDASVGRASNAGPRRATPGPGPGASAAAGGSLDLATPHPRHSRPRAQAGPPEARAEARRQRPRTSGVAAPTAGALRELGGGDDPFDALSGGAAPPALDLDLSGPALPRVSRPRRPAPTARRAAARRVSRQPTRWHYALGVSLIALVGALGYLVTRPEPPSLTDEALPAGDVRLRVQQRRDGLDKLPPHLRDVSF